MYVEHLGNNRCSKILANKDTGGILYPFILVTVWLITRLGIHTSDV